MNSKAMKLQPKATKEEQAKLSKEELTKVDAGRGIAGLRYDDPNYVPRWDDPVQ